MAFLPNGILEKTKTVAKFLIDQWQCYCCGVDMI